MFTRFCLLMVCLYLAGCSQLGMRQGESPSAAGQTAQQATRPDAEFMTDIAQANLAEIALKHQAATKKLQLMSGVSFDRAVAQANDPQLRAHRLTGDLVGALR